MFNAVAEKTVARLLMVGAPLITLFIVTDTVTDPVNAPKLLLAGALGFALISIFLFFNLKENLRNFLPLIGALVLFMISAINSVLGSNSPITQQIYGAYGRNTGLVAYLALSFISLGTLNLRDQKSFKFVIFGLQFAGLLNVMYCSWVLVFGDFIKWSNPYGNILGTFGNPNFISAFLGIFISSLAAFSFNPGVSNKYRFSALIVGVIAFYQVYRSHAVQGIAVTAAGLGIVGFYVLRSKFKSQFVSLSYSGMFVILGVTAVLGALQKGPFDFIYKRTVSLRGIYWNTAINMSQERPFSGVGLDSYGDWYRQARPLKALTDPGVNTTSNAAHNVPLDLLANGGWPLFLTYLATIGFGLLAILKITFRQKSYDGVFVTLAVSWLCYQLQSVISINQIGLAVWGWMLTGALVAYEYSTRTDKTVSESPRSKSSRRTNSQTSEIISPQLVAGIGLAVGIFIACPPMSADTKWRGAMESQDANQAIAALKPGYFSPSDSQRYAQALQIFAGSNLMDQAHNIALAAVEFNPDNYQSWRNLYFLSNATAEEKARALKNLKRLDPLNPDVTAP
ncbi:RfaL Lipid A core - O-antigen ligase and related enzymes [Candidatus Nanopelagicaceae bacterium]